MKKCKILISIFLSILIVFSSTPTIYADEWDAPLYKNHDGQQREDYGGGGSNNKSKDGGSSSSSEGTKLSAEDQATHDSQQNIRKGTKDIVAKIKNKNFVNLYNDGQTSIYGGKIRLDDSDFTSLLNKVKDFQKNRTKGDYGLEFNQNEVPRDMDKARKPDMTTSEKKDAQEGIAKLEDIKPTSGSTTRNRSGSYGYGNGSSSQDNDITVGNDGKINFNSPINTINFDPPNSSYASYVKDLVNNGIRDFTNWDSRYETFKNYYDKMRNPDTKEITGTGITTVGFYGYLGLLASYDSFIKHHHQYFETNWDSSAATFAEAQKKVQRKQKSGLVCLVPPSWGIADLGLKNGKSKGQVHGTPGGFGDCYSGDLTKYLKRITKSGSDSPVGKTPAEACRKGLLHPGDICSCDGFEHTFVYTGYMYDCFEGGGGCAPYTNGIRLSYKGWTDSRQTIGEVLRWKDSSASYNGIKGSSNRVMITNNSVMKNHIIGSPEWAKQFSLEDFEDVAYIESYYLTSVNRKYYKITDYSSDSKKYKLYDPKGKLIKEGETTSNELNIKDLNEPGKYKLEWWQYCEVTTGTTVGYLKRQYLVLLPSNTILYYKEEFKDDDPIFIEQNVDWKWEKVGTATKEVKDTNAIETRSTLIERTE